MSEKKSNSKWMFNYSILDKFKKTQESFNKAKKELDEVYEIIEDERKKLSEKLEKLKRDSMFSQFDETQITNFFKEPYVIIPKKHDEWYVIAPKFMDFQIGWLEKSTTSYNVFIVNKYMHWLANVPKEIESKFKFKPIIPLKIYDGMLLTGKIHQDEAWNRYSSHLVRREGSDKIRVKSGHEFKLIADMVNDGILPFIPKEIEKEDIKQLPKLPEWLEKITSRDYFKDAIKKFDEVGAVGIYWAYSTGKSLFGLIQCLRLKGRKLVVVPTVTLREQWEERLSKFNALHNCDVVTYHSYHKIRYREYVLTVFDECHHLPANTFSRLATIKSKYRIGLSATPYREDGRTDYIFALTGFPMGMDWQSLIEMGFVKKPTIKLYIFSKKQDKITKLNELIQDERKTIIFCDSIRFGEQISKKFDIPHVYGSTRNRLDIINESNTTVVSRVGDEGISLPDIERVIEVDFLFGSRRQEGQRLGRLFHSEKIGEHIIMMTEEEFNKYEKRLYAIYEKGFKIDVVR